MPVKFTPEQQKVIELRNCSILVSAAAGSGKTAVLTERIVREVCDGERPVDIDRLLVVTFTNAAAAEMRERIAAKIAERLEETPDSAHVQRQATLLHNAQITTIDSFCLFLLRNHFNEIGLDPAFRIADEGEVKLMQQDVLKELIEDAYASGDEDFRYCVEYFCPGGRESVLEKHVLNLSRYAASFPWPGEWLLERKRDYGATTPEELCESSYGKYLTGHLSAMAEGWLQKMERVRKLVQEPDGPYMFGELVDGEIEQLEQLGACETLEAYAARLPALSFGTLPRKKDDSVSATKRELAVNLRAEVKKSVQGTAEKLFATPLPLAAAQGAACGRPVGSLIDLTLEFDRRMAAKKREKKVIDFSDVEHFALDILIERREGELRPSRVALEYRQHFAEVLIDEYQDSNLVQEFLLRAVSGEEEGHFNRFMVGDVKQSIYKFRLARPELFLEKYESYAEAEENVPGRDGEAEAGENVPWASGEAEAEPLRPTRVRIDLAKNFRSRAEVVEAVNDVFSRLMSPRVGGLAYDEKAALYPGAVYPENVGNESELLLVEKPGKDAGETEKQREARAIAAKIKALRERFLVTDRESGELRPVRYSDVVILLRTNSGWDEEFKEVLEEEGIPVYVTSKTGYFGATEVQELLQVLRVLDNPRQDIPLFGVMKSLFGGFSEEEVALIRSAHKGCSLYEAVKRFAEGASSPEREEIDGRGTQPPEPEEIDGRGTQPPEREGTGARGTQPPEREETDSRGTQPPEREGTSALAGEPCLREKARRFLEVLGKYRRYTVYMPVRELLTALVTDFDYLNYVTALPAGGKRRANVEMLFTRASDFEKTSYFGLFHFVRYVEQLEKYDVDYGEAEGLDENADVVRIMSIHKSKGLEFPVTFVAGLSKRLNMQDANQSLILDVDLGLATDYVDPERRLKNKTLRRLALARKLREDSLSEELRVLYVAMTRAREKLILTATLEKAEEKWQAVREGGTEFLSFSDFMESGSLLDFLLPVLGKTCIQVSVVQGEELAAVGMREQMDLGDRKRRLEQDLPVDEEALKTLRERLGAAYAHEDLRGLYTKTTVSELKIAAMADRDEAAFHTFEEREVQPYVPAFRREAEGVSGTVRGNAYHRAMELMDFGRLLGDVRDAEMDYEEYRRSWGTEEARSRLRTFLAEEAESRRLKQEYLAALNEKKLLHFLRSELGFRMWRAERAGKLYREQPFVMALPASRLGKDFPDSESVLIQGIIDVFFEEDGGLVLLDYKTDAVPSMGELWNRYETQMDYYGEALRKLTGKPVRERVLYSFHLEEFG